MDPVETANTNIVFTAPGCYDLPARRYENQHYGGTAHETCWELTDEELDLLNKTKRVYLSVMGSQHPPVRLSVYPEP